MMYIYTEYNTYFLALPVKSLKSFHASFHQAGIIQDKKAKHQAGASTISEWNLNCANDWANWGCMLV